jgi:hypothetical protein
LDEQALDLLEAGYRRAEYQEREGRQLLLTMLDGEVALTAEMDAETPEHRASVSALVDSGAVVVPDIRDQDQAGATFYEITPEGEEMLYTKRADSLRTAA